MNDFHRLSARIATTMAKYEATENFVLEQIGLMVWKNAYEKFGVWQDASGPYEAWPKYDGGYNLAASTRRRRSLLGTSIDDPLYRPGQPEADGQYLRDTVSFNVRGNTVYIGSTSPLMVTHEHGSEPIPPRPVLGPALFEKREEIVAFVGSMFVGAKTAKHATTAVFRGLRSEVPF